MKILVLLLLVVYGIYFEASVWISALDKQGGYYKLCHIAEELKQLDTEAVFRQYGMTLVKQGTNWRGKTIDLRFYIQEKDGAIPSEIEQFIYEQADSVGHSRINVEIRRCPSGEYTNDRDALLLKDKMYFWWRILY